MVPHAAPLQPEPLTAQVTAVFELPVTVATNSCITPGATVALPGDTEIATEAAGASTLRVAVSLVTLPALLETATLNSARLSEDVTGVVVYVEEVAPLIALPFFIH